MDTADFVLFIEAEHHVRMSKHNFRCGLQTLLCSAGANVHTSTSARFCEVRWLEGRVLSALSREWHVLSVQIKQPAVPGETNVKLECDLDVEECLSGSGARCCSRYNVTVSFAADDLGRAAISCAGRDPTAAKSCCLSVPESVLLQQSVVALQYC